MSNLWDILHYVNSVQHQTFQSCICWKPNGLYASFALQSVWYGLLKTSIIYYRKIAIMKWSVKPWRHIYCPYLVQVFQNCLFKDEIYFELNFCSNEWKCSIAKIFCNEIALNWQHLHSQNKEICSNITKTTNYLQSKLKWPTSQFNLTFQQKYVKLSGVLQSATFLKAELF